MVVAADRRNSTSLLLLRLGSLRLQVQDGLECALRQVVIENVATDLSHVHLSTLLQLVEVELLAQTELTAHRTYALHIT